MDRTACLLLQHHKAKLKLVNSSRRVWTGHQLFAANRTCSHANSICIGNNTPGIMRMRLTCSTPSLYSRPQKWRVWQPTFTPDWVSWAWSFRLLSSPGLGLVPGQGDSPYLTIISLITIPRVEFYTVFANFLVNFFQLGNVDRWTFASTSICAISFARSRFFLYWEDRTLAARSRFLKVCRVKTRDRQLFGNWPTRFCEGAVIDTVTKRGSKSEFY